MSIQSTQDHPLQALHWSSNQQPQPAQHTRQHTTPPGATITSEKQSVLLGFILGALSIFCSMFPFCGLPMAASGLVMGLLNRRSRALRRLAAWTITLSALGIILTLVNIIISVNIYLHSYLWR